MKAYTRVYNQLKEIEKTAGSKAKAVLLNLYLQDDDFKKVVCMMLNPFVTFGINKFTASAPLNDPCSEEAFWGTLEKLSSRTWTGQAARVGLWNLTIAGVPPDLLERILNKDPGAGFKASSVNKVCQGLIPEFSYMRCSLPKQVLKKPLPYETGVIAQLKSDGMFINLNREEDCALMYTRQGNPLPMEKFPEIEARAMSLMVGTQTHGEIVIYRDGVLLPREIGNGLINAIIEGATLAENEKAVLQVWDQIPISCAVKKGKYGVPYKNRFAGLRDQLSTDTGVIHLIEHKWVYSRAESKAYFKEVLQRGLEGTVDKDPEMPWEDGTSKGQVKNKGNFECDLKIVGYREGKGKNAATFGSVICQSTDGLLEVAVSGMSDEIRDYIHKRRDELLDTILRAVFNCITSPSPSNKLHSLFLPRIDELRKDKIEADSLEKIKADYAAVIEAM